MRFIPVTLLSVVSSFILSGCLSQPSMYKSDGTSVIIDAQPLSHLPESAKVEISLIYNDHSVKSEVIEEGGYLPYDYELPVEADKQASVKKIKVTASIGTQRVLEGEKVLPIVDDAPVVLHALSELVLKNTYWRAEDISGRGIPPSTETTLVFNSNNRLSGYAGCNLYQSAYASLSVFLEIDKARLTRQRCSSPIMYHENRYLALLTSAEYFSIDEQGNLAIYLSEREKPLKFTPITYPEAQQSMILQ